MENNNIKKYISPEKLGLYDSKIKEFLATADEATLEAAKAYAEEKLAEAAAAHKTDVDALDTRVKAVEDDYLTSEDKTELSNAIGAETERATAAEDVLTQAVATEKQRAEGVESTLSQAIATEKERAEAAEGILTQAVATEKERAEAAEGVLTQAIADEKARAEAAEAGLQTQINTIMNNPDAEGAINSINEFTQYVTEHGTIAEGMRQDINKNKDDIAAEAGRATAAEEALAGRVKDLEDNKAGYATTTEVATAKQEAIDAAKTESANGDVVVLAEAQKYADAKIAEAQADVTAHTGNADIHVTTDDKATWNAALQASDITAGGANGTIAVKGTDVAVKGLGTAAYENVDAFDTAGAAAAVQGALDTEVERATAAEAALQAAIEAFVEVTEDEILALFN